ncbi:hypothetical protein [Reichenbachiella sp.]|uniref:hypothetical protein n=1 Tax=Reichenbachiella sp. TaxID=2184521 RepID=UPI003BB16B42
MNQLKLLSLLFLVLFACKQRGNNQSQYEVNLELSAVLMNDDSIVFNPVQQFIFKANNGKVINIPLGNGVPFGVRVDIGQMVDGDDESLGHKVVFLKQHQGEWQVFGESSSEELALDKKIQLNVNAMDEGSIVGGVSGIYTIISL